jgi:FxsC-like protein
MSCFFFFSYATGDDPEATSHKRQFFDDLETQISNHRDYDKSVAKVGFLDAEIPTGTDWKPGLATALKTCRAFVYLQEPIYFNFAERPWCGREWRVFRDRLDEHTRQLGADAQRPPLMIPVVWRIMPQLPDVVSAIQFKDRGLGDVYPQLGLFPMKSRPENNKAYVTLVANLANHIVQMANVHRIAPLADLPPMQDIADPFKPVTAPTPPPGKAKEGPGYVDFVYVVAPKNELRGHRKFLDGYDDTDDPRLWKPYFPPEQEPVAKIAERLAFKKNLMTDRIDFGPDLIKRLQDSQRAQRIVVAILDPWTLRLPQYHALMEEFGRINFWNCVVVIPWNEDDETRQQSDALDAIVSEIFFDLTPGRVRSQIRSSKDFVRMLAKAFLTARQKIEEYATLKKPVSGPGLRTLPGFAGV